MSRPLDRLLVRKDFLRVAGGRRKSVSPGLILQALPGETPAITAEGRRVGYTASKKVGNAVARNRAKRRLREAARRVLAPHGLPEHDYVLIARAETPKRPFGLLLSDLEAALRRLKVWRDA